MHFEKVSYEQWSKDMPYKNIPASTLMRWYHEIKLPQQGTTYSMGVDFFMPYKTNILPYNKIKIPTGIRWVCDTEEDRKYGLLIVPRSSIGIKNGLRLLNTIGVVDADYYLSDNEGHIMLFMENTTDDVVVLNNGKGIVQGLIVPYITPQFAETNTDRHGGFGSTDS